MNNAHNEEFLEIINIEILTSILFLITIIISIAIEYNIRLGLTGKKKFWNREETKNMSELRRLIALIAAGLALYSSVKLKEHSEKYNKSDNDKKAANLEVSAATLAFIAAILILQARAISDTEGEPNPEL